MTPPKDDSDINFADNLSQTKGNRSSLDFPMPSLRTIVLILLAVSIILLTGSAVIIYIFETGPAAIREHLAALQFLPLMMAAAGAIYYGITAANVNRERLKKLHAAIETVTDGNPAEGTGESESRFFAGEDQDIDHITSALVQRAGKINRERNRFRSIFQSLTDGVIIFDRLGRVVSVNPAAEDAICLLESTVKGEWQIGLREIEMAVTAPDLVSDDRKVSCWSSKNCVHTDCPAYESEDLRCWLQCGTHCHNEIQGTFSQKRDACERCDVYARNGILLTEFSRAGRDFTVTVSPILDEHGLEEGRMALFHEITDLKSAGEALKRRNKDLTVINEIAAAMSGSFGDINVVMHEALIRVAEAVEVKAGAILLKEPEEAAFKLAAHKGFSNQLAVFMQLLDISTSLDGFFDRRSGLIDVDRFFSRHQSVEMMLSREGFRRPLIVPIMAKGDLLGLMLLVDDKKDSFNEEDLRLVTAVAVNVGVTSRNQELLNGFAKAKQTWETTFDAMTDGVSVIDSEHNIVRVNRAMAELLGKTKQSLIGRKCFEVIHGRADAIPECPMQQVVTSRESVCLEVAEPSLGKMFRLSVNPLFDDDGSVAGLVHVMRDITERKQLREQLLQSEKMAAVGQLVSGVAHELNNPLTGVIGYTQLMLRQCESTQQRPAAKDLHAVLSEAERASRIVQSLLSFARKHEPRKNYIDINDAVRTVVSLRAYELNVSNIKVKTDLDPELPRTMADIHQIEQVLLNIINNAEHALADCQRPGVISISTSHADGRVRIEIADNGTGMDAADLVRIYEPFFTTKEVGRGTGLGLSICYGIIEEHGGEISADSRKGEGTTMRIDLPLTCGIDAPGSRADGVHPDGESRGKVLVVDDEPAIVDLLTDILTTEGHGVDVARDGAAAMEKLVGSRYDSVITDIKMPHMGGCELHQRISEIDPELAANVIFITGDAVSRDTRDYLERTGNLYLVKPFNFHELREVLHKVMAHNGN